jgi:hypothetical protein
MDETTFSFAAADGSDIAVYRWSGDGAPKAIVQIAHGMGEHAARYRRLAEPSPQPATSSTPTTIAATARPPDRLITTAISVPVVGLLRRLVGRGVAWVSSRASASRPTRSPA